MPYTIRLQKRVRKVEHHFGVKLHESCAREAFDIALPYHGADHPSMLIIIQGSKLLVTGVWGLVSKCTFIEDIRNVQKNLPLESSLFMPLENLNSCTSNKDLLRCVIPLTEHTLFKTSKVSNCSKLYGMAAIYRRIDYINVFAILTVGMNSKKSPILLDMHDTHRWLDKVGTVN